MTNEPSSLSCTTSRTQPGEMFANSSTSPAPEGTPAEVHRPDGVYLEECEPPFAQFHVPRADYLITVDADSLLLHDYALRLIPVMERPEGRRLGVAQTPYTAVPKPLLGWNEQPERRPISSGSWARV